MPFLSLCIVLFDESLGPAGETLAQCSRPPVRVSHSSRDLPSHVLVIASPLVCGARRVFVLPPPPQVLSTVFLFKYAYSSVYSFSVCVFSTHTFTGPNCLWKIVKEIWCLNKSGYGPLPIAILAQSFVVFFNSPVNRAQARQHWAVFFWDGG